MSKWSKAREKDIDQRIARALIVGEYTDESALDYLGRSTRAGRSR